MKAIYQLFNLIRIVQVESENLLELANISLSYNVSGYDAGYLLVAKKMLVPLATLDRKMAIVAKQLDVELYKPN